MTTEAALTALAIFGLRVFNNAIGTLRLVLITRDMRFWSAVLAFIEALVFAVVIANVVNDLSNALNMIAYCGGFAIGGYVGMAIEARFITSFMVATVISSEKGHEIATRLRERGFGVTETVGEGRDGMVSMVRSVIKRREVSDLLTVIRDVQPEAFISVEEARAIQHGWLRNEPRNGRRL